MVQDRIIRTLLRWGKKNKRSFPWREENDTFRILIAELLLQRSRSSTVAKVYPSFIRRWGDPSSLAAAGEEDIRDVIYPLGLTSRASSLIRLAQQIEDDGMPIDVEGLMSLPGVGRYVAHATLGQPAVDSVSARVYSRVYAASSEDPWATVRRVSPKRSRELNHAVLDLAASICLPQIPRCEVCPLTLLCMSVT